MNQDSESKNVESDRLPSEPRVAECPVCNGYGRITEELEISCDLCDGYGRITENQLSAYLTPPAFDDWKAQRELRAIDE